MSTRAEELIRRLDLAPHPEGGWFRETFRSTLEVDPLDGRPRRAALTGIYFLLTRGQFSRWHRVASDEIWTHVEGDPLRLVTFAPRSGEVEESLLGPFGLADGERDVAPQRVVRAGVWQAAEPLGGFACGACFVGPGFDFADFVLLDADPETRASLKELDPSLLRFA